MSWSHAFVLVALVACASEPRRRALAIETPAWVKTGSGAFAEPEKLLRGVASIAAEGDTKPNDITVLAAADKALGEVLVEFTGAVEKTLGPDDESHWLLDCATASAKSAKLREVFATEESPSVAGRAEVTLASLVICVHANETIGTDQREKILASLEAEFVRMAKKPQR